MIRRSRLEVFFDILKAVAQEGEVRRTKLMYKANLAWGVLKDAVETMEKRGMVKSVVRPTGVYVSVTEEGHELLRRFTSIESAFASQGQRRSVSIASEATEG